MILGYNTNGFAHHRLEDAVGIIAELGYGGVALTPDVNHDANGFDPRGLNVVVETGARFQLDPKRKHRPTLLDPFANERMKRFDSLTGGIKLAPRIGSTIVSYWSGSSDTNDDQEVLMARLVEECKRLTDEAAALNIRLAFEPEPGMFIDAMDKFAELHARVNHPNFGLTLDVGHLVCLNELPISKHIHAWKHCLWNVHLDDMKGGVHDHLMFGEGEVDFDDAFTALKEIDYRGMASVELSRHSYDAVNAAAKSMQFLKRFV